MTSDKPIIVDGYELPADTVFESPIPCDFKVGDRVIYTNPQEVEFERVVRGFSPEPQRIGGELAWIYIFTDAWWFPVSPTHLRKKVLPEGVGIW